MSGTRVQQYQDRARAEAVDSSGLEAKRLMFLEAVAIIVGTSIGAGVLSMAYASRKTGSMPLLLWLAVAGLLTTISMPYVSETTLHTYTHNQLNDLARRYVGSLDAWAIFLPVAANSIGALIVYMSDNGKILNAFFGISPALGSVLFFIPAAGVLHLGLNAVGKGERFINIGMINMILALVAVTLLNDSTEPARLLGGDWICMVPVFSIAVLYFPTQYIVPGIARGFNRAPERPPKAMVIGILTIFTLLNIVPFSVITLTDLENQSEVAILAWGKALGEWAFFTANTLILCTILTPYWGLGDSFLTNIFDKFHKLSLEDRLKTRLLALATVALPPFVLAYNGLIGSVDALCSARTFSRVVLSIMPILMLRSVCRDDGFEPIWKCDWIAHPVIQSVVVMIYLVSAAHVIRSAMNLLPTGW